MLRKLSKMMEVSLQQLTKLNDKEFNFLLTDCEIISAAGKWNLIGAERLLDGIPTIGTKRLGKARLKCGERW